MLSLAFAYMRSRRLVTGLNMLLLALAVASLTILLLVSSQLSERLERNAQGIDLVVGAKGSPLQLILSSIYQMDQPTGNIPLTSIDMLRRDPAVAGVVPLALGDNFRGYRIVGTEPAYPALYGADLATGRMFEKHGEAVMGAVVAAKLGAGLGQKFVGSHGLGDGEGAGEHHSNPFTTVGILKPTGTVIDRLILASVQTVWDVHGIAHDDEDHDYGTTAHDGHAEHHHDAHADNDSDTLVLAESRDPLAPEVTALLVRYRNAAGALRIPSMINRQTDMQAAVPAVETTRLLSLLGVGIDGARLFAWLLAAVGGLSIFVTLLNAASAREGDLALLRVMGATRARVFGTVIAEGLATALAGGVLGLLIGHLVLMGAVRGFAALGELGLRPWQPHPGELAILAVVTAIGFIAALVPALRVFRVDLTSTLARAN
ncbi:ABC transporter permease [Tsuneonella sp. CC-YZS046]|uniref:ABC transporter permease n=1 Tax=Tsuneonella sp. CC-YZS046 TaxID=3042152 RepID=UPI002D79964B|nr:ABC transporter permease [Tsuneonella sp. CC-YZS046]WRO67391.1 ABC transporter permease [Tsuneonella sp. CC-YZS046]